jgi:class 3 adenylate cyclase
MLAFGRFELQPERRSLLLDGVPMALGARAFDLLLALFERRDRVVTKTELLDIVWPGLVVEENNVQVQISTLRKLLGTQAIATIPGRGYQFTLQPDRPLDTTPAVATESTQATSAQRLKQVTLLFLDVVGSPALSEKLDLEDLGALVDGALARCASIIVEHGGKVLRYAGDSLLAAFGADETQEDDAERSVRSGLALLADLWPQGSDAKTQPSYHELDVRVGIHTGRVLLDDGASAKGGSIRGIAVNIAARMQQCAPPGGLRISHDTYRHVRGLFDVTAEVPVAVNGIAATLRSYLVVRLKTRVLRRANRDIDGFETRFIGRASELARLADEYEAVLEERQLSIVTVVGEAGLGKSRLLREFDHWLELRPEEVRVFHGRAGPQDRNNPYGLLHDLFAWRFEILDSDSQALAQAK